MTIKTRKQGFRVGQVLLMATMGSGACVGRTDVLVGENQEPAISGTANASGGSEQVSSGGAFPQVNSGGAFNQVSSGGAFNQVGGGQGSPFPPIGVGGTASLGGAGGGKVSPGGAGTEIDRSELQLWLKLDEASTNGLPADSSGKGVMADYGLTKPLVVSTVPPALKFSTAALKFDGVATVEIPRSEALTWPESSNSYTISLWANVQQLQYWSAIISNIPGPNPGFCGIAIDPNGLWSFESNGQDILSMGISVRGAAAKIGTWQHVAIVQDGVASTNTIYVDGVAGPANARGSTPCNSTVGFSIGSKDGDNFVGMVDDVRIYGSALTEAQVKELFAGKETITP